MPAPKAKPATMSAAKGKAKGPAKKPAPKAQPLPKPAATDLVTPGPGGRPTLYRPEVCDQVIAWGGQGKSLAWMAAELDVCKQTLLNWSAAHPEFLAALSRAKAKAQRWWEDAGQDALSMPGFNASVWAKSMAARFPDDWREKTETAVTGKDGGAIRTEGTHKVTTLSDLYAVMAGAIKPDSPGTPGG